MHRLLTGVFVFALVAVPWAAAPGVGGTWTMTVDAGPHGRTTMRLALKQEGNRVTGTFSSPHGDVKVEGKFADGELQLTTVSDEDQAEPITFNARLKANDTLEGYLSSAMGDMTWTAERANDKS